LESALLYKMTIWTGPTYDEAGGRGVLTIEGYFNVALWGSRRENRNHYLPSICIPYFKDWVADRIGIYVSDSDVNVRFETEGLAETEDEEITVDFRIMTYRGKRVTAQSYPQETIPIETGGSEYDPDADESELDDDLDDWEDEDDEW